MWNLPQEHDHRKGGGLMSVDEALVEYQAHRKLLKHPLTPYGLTLIKKKLEGFYPGDESMQIESINQSIERGWRGVFEVKEDGDGEFA